MECSYSGHRYFYMPDWSYQPLLKPLLFSLPAGKARQVALSSMAWLARMPGGTWLIDMMGHMSPPKSIAAQICGVTVCSKVGLGAGIDPEGKALEALSRFGFGLIELGPVSNIPCESPNSSRERNPEMCALISSEPPPCFAIDDVISNISRYRSKSNTRQVGIAVRVSQAVGSNPARAAGDTVEIISKVPSLADWIVLDTRWLQTGDERSAWNAYLVALAELLAATSQSVPLMVALNPGIEVETMCQMIADAQSKIDLTGIVVAGGMLLGEKDQSTKRIYGAPTFAQSVECVKAIRNSFGKSLLIIGSGGIIEPADALEFFDSGADFVQLNSGMVFSGPGLPKRINEAVEEREHAEPDTEPSANVLKQGWFYSFLLGLGMTIGGILAWILGMTRVVLPYDEKFLGINRAQIYKINPNLLHFMMHDRVTLAGTMISIGIIYIGLSAFGIRQGQHWAWKAMNTSAAIGFSSFFLYLGFGYFDPLHAAVSLLLLPFFLAGLFLGPGPRRPTPPLSHRNDPAWRSAMLGQLLLVMVAIGLVLAGLTISGVGITHVFVPTDLAFLKTTPEVIRAANPHLLPMIAHDRAGFGGALASNGLAVLFTVLWGIRSGAKWVWWTLVIAAIPGYFGVFMIHMMIGYMNPVHVGPAWAAFLLTAIGLALCYRFMCGAKTSTKLDKVD